MRVPPSLPAGRLPVATKLRLATEVLRTFASVRRRMKATDVRDLLAELRAEGPPSPREPDAAATRDALRLGRAVSRTLGPLPVDATCLARSLVLVAMLARRGLPATLVIGVRPGGRRNAEAPANGGFGAHAWVEVGGRPVLEPGDFARLTDL